MTNDGEFTGYRREPDGQFTLHYGFRNTAGYHFRTSQAGRLVYWLLDHSEVMRIYNSRKKSACSPNGRGRQRTTTKAMSPTAPNRRLRAKQCCGAIIVRSRRICSCRP